MTNKKLGNDFETAFCQTLFENGYWCHNLAQNQSGQPADVIAVKNGNAHLIDCKVCSNRGFTLSRVEENQVLAMELWRECGNGDGWFAVLIAEEVFMLPYSTINWKLRLGESSLNEKYIRSIGVSLKEWMDV